MKTLLVLTDFSAAATHAAKYAALFAKQIGAKRILLLNKLQSITAIPKSPLVVNRAVLDREDALNHLQLLANEIKFSKPTYTELSFIAKEGELHELTAEMISKYLIDLVIMGLTGKSRLEQTLIGSNTMHMAKTATKPLLIVPEVAKLTPITKIAFILDLMELKHIHIVSMIMGLFQTPLQVYMVSYENDHTHASSHHNHHLTAMKQKLAEYNPNYYFIHEVEVVGEILHFIDEHDVSLVVHIEKKKNLFENLFLTDVTERMAYVIKVPLLLVKQS